MDPDASRIKIILAEEAASGDCANEAAVRPFKAKEQIDNNKAI